MKRKTVIKGIINYIFAVIFSIIFALFMDANVGWFMVLSLILAPVLSLVFAWIASRCVTVECDMPEAVLGKNDECTMQVRVKNSSIFPTPPVELVFTNEPRVHCKSRETLVSVMPWGSKELSVDFKARICGPAYIGIEKVKITDYLGLFSFDVKNKGNNKTKVCVIPEIAEISPNDENIIKAIQTSMHSDDSEDTVESTTYAFGGFPGYDSREYVPGDPLKRINWKQSVKRKKLLVRLDDEMASQTISVVLDSVFSDEGIDVEELEFYEEFAECTKEDIIPSIAQCAVENALGIMRVLLLKNYTLDFYVMKSGSFVRYVLEDEGDLEQIRTDLAEFDFSKNEGIERFPKDSIMENSGSVSIFSTPKADDMLYYELSEFLGESSDKISATIYSAEEKIRSQGGEESYISIKNFKNEVEEHNGLRDKLKSILGPLVIPYLLAITLCMATLGVFKVPLFSGWLFVSAVLCAVVFGFCSYVKKHKFIGGLLVFIVTMGILMIYTRTVFSGDYGATYSQWFMSGGDVVDNTSTYLGSVLLLFGTFYAMVVFYFTQALYRTSFLMLTSLIPFMIYVKVIHNINIYYVVVMVVLNIAAFLVNVRKNRDKSKKIENYMVGILSVTLYGLMFVLTALSVPRGQEAKYYYIFETLFLGGNVNVSLPQEYSDVSEHSGNADDFNELANRKLYTVYTKSGLTLYLKRQTFDYYNYEKDYWYEDVKYATPQYELNAWEGDRKELSIAYLARAMRVAEIRKPGFLTSHTLSNLINTEFYDMMYDASVCAENFPSRAFIIPTWGFDVDATYGRDKYTRVTRHGVLLFSDYLTRYERYNVHFYDEFASRFAWVKAGGANFTDDESIEMLEELVAILKASGDETHLNVAQGFYEQAVNAKAYKELCQKNTNLVSERVKELALEITKDCIYDWEKAEALQEYFAKNGYTYDLNYKAEDKSVEYFLFESKRGTCSDYATAYVLMARAVGLTVRYVEGFTPDEELEGNYVVRTKDAHAYPEVYIQNMGYVVYEPTNPEFYSGSQGNNIAAIMLFAGYRILIMFALVSGCIVVVLFTSTVFAPYIKEQWFLHKVKKSPNDKAIVMIYNRLSQKECKKYIKNSKSLTPYEFGRAFESTLGMDISEMVYTLEECVYGERSTTMADVQCVLTIYKQAKTAIKEYKKQAGKRRKSKSFPG